MRFGAFMGTVSFKGEWKISVYKEEAFSEVEDFVVFGTSTCDAEPMFTFNTDGGLIIGSFLQPKWCDAEVEYAIVTNENHLYVFLSEAIASDTSL